VFVALFLAFIVAFFLSVAGLAMALFIAFMIFQNRKPGSGYSTLGNSYPLNHIRYPAGLNETGLHYCRVLFWSLGFVVLPPFVWLGLAFFTMVVSIA
jgi:hypothetical protein